MNVKTTNTNSLPIDILPDYSDREIIGNREWSIIFIEMLVYISLAGRIFIRPLGIYNITGLSGAIILASGIICFAVMIIKRERLPTSIFFIIGITLFANLTDVLKLGMLAKEPLFAASFFLMLCYIFRSPNAAKRFCFFLAACVFYSVIMGGTYASEGYGHLRLQLDSNIVATVFANSNNLAQVALVPAIALLFFSLRSRLFTKLLCWLSFIGLSAVALLTVSRQGVVLLGVGLFFYFTAAFMSRKNKIAPFAVLLLLLVTASLFATQTTEITENYLYRFSLGSERINYWLSATEDMADTIINGYGTTKAYTADGYQPHNTFLWMHLAYGGICAYLYLAWLFWMGFKVLRLFFVKDIEANIKIETLAMFLIYFLGQAVNVFALSNYGFLLATVMIEHNASHLPRQDSSE
jgi:hypothetical protein